MYSSVQLKNARNGWKLNSSSVFHENEKKSSWFCPLLRHFGFHEELPAYFSRMKWCLEPRAPPGDDRHFLTGAVEPRRPCGTKSAALFVRVVSDIWRENWRDNWGWTAYLSVVSHVEKRSLRVSSVTELGHSNWYISCADSRGSYLFSR